MDGRTDGWIIANGESHWPRKPQRNALENSTHPAETQGGQLHHINKKSSIKSKNGFKFLFQNLTSVSRSRLLYKIWNYKSVAGNTMASRRQFAGTNTQWQGWTCSVWATLVAILAVPVTGMLAALQHHHHHHHHHHHPWFNCCWTSHWLLRHYQQQSDWNTARLCASKYCRNNLAVQCCTKLLLVRPVNWYKQLLTDDELTRSVAAEFGRHGMPPPDSDDRYIILFLELRRGRAETYRRCELMTLT